MGSNPSRLDADPTTSFKRSELLSDPDVRRWYDNMVRGSPLTAKGRLRKLGRFCEMHHTTPAGLVAMATDNLRATTDMLQDHITMAESKDYSPGYIEEHVNSVKSWLRHFDITIRRRTKISHSGFSPTLQNERVPELHEISEIYERAELRESVIISMMAKSGLRPGVMGNHDGTDGLQVRDLPDITLDNGKVECVQMPNRIVVRRELSKAGHRYFTFSTDHATKLLLEYLNDRLEHGEVLDEHSPVIHPNDHHNKWRRSQKAFLPTQRISDKIRRVFRPKFTWRPYVLRAYFDTQLLIAESRGKIAHDFRVFFMGHKGTIESLYTTNKGILPTVLVSEMAGAFTRSEEHLDQACSDRNLSQRQQIQEMIDQATPRQIERVLDVMTQAMKAGFEANQDTT